MAEPQDQQRRTIMEILRGRNRPTTTAAGPDELLSDVDLAAIPEDAVDNGTTPILGQARSQEAFDFPGPYGNSGGADYSQTQEFQATPDDRAAQGEGNNRVTGNIISQGVAPDEAFAPASTEFDDAWWNAPDDGPTREEAVSEAMFDYNATLDPGPC